MLFDKLLDNFDRHIAINGVCVIQIVLSVLINEFIFRTRVSQLNAFIILQSVKSRTTVMKCAGLHRDGISIITAQPRPGCLDFIGPIMIGIYLYRFCQPIFNSDVKSTPFIKEHVYLASPHLRGITTRGKDQSYALGITSFHHLTQRVSLNCFFSFKALLIAKSIPLLVFK